MIVRFDFVEIFLADLAPCSTRVGRLVRSNISLYDSPQDKYT